MRDTEKGLVDLRQVTNRIIVWIPPDAAYFSGCQGIIKHQDLYDLWRDALRGAAKSVGAIVFEGNPVFEELKKYP